MMFLEMSRDEMHGGDGWGFTQCLWSPTEKMRGGRWPYWTKILDVSDGDLIFHLRGKSQKAYFVGYSRAFGNGYETDKRPPAPGSWSFAESFYRADLQDFVPFENPIKLTDVFATRRQYLEGYFDANKEAGTDKRHVFFVRQAGRLQCLNGAYLSDIDDSLFSALFDIEKSLSTGRLSAAQVISVRTGEQLRSIRVRIGQSDFSEAIKGLYRNKCCFPSCPVTDRRFLIGSHIARWTDNPSLRGNLGNGLCLCLVHDKAFELGLFTLDKGHRIFVNPKEGPGSSPLVDELRAAQGKPMEMASVVPLIEALEEHWRRVKLSPSDQAKHSTATGLRITAGVQT
jgi:putative restriction endonuclease